MLLDPAFLGAEPGKVLAVLAVAVLGKGLAALLIVLASGHPVRTALTVAAGLAQIGEFSFILAVLGRDLDLAPEEGHSLILAGALLSITLNPAVFRAIGPLETWLRQRPALAAFLERRSGALARLPEDGPHEARSGHVVLCGHGRVGRVIADLFTRRRVPYVVVEQDRRRVEELRAQGVPALYGDAANPRLLAHADLATVAVLMVAIPAPPAIRHIVEHARRVNPAVRTVVRTHSEAERAYLQRHGAGEAVLGELALALEMARFALTHLRVEDEEVEVLLWTARDENAPERASQPVTAEATS